MKEELISLKNKVQELRKSADEFSSEVDSFNTAVKTNYAGEEFEADPEYDLFYAAKKFMEENSELYEIASKVRKEHPRYGEKRFVQTVIDTMQEANNTDQTTEEIQHKIATYLLFERAGYNDVEEKFNELTNNFDDVDLATRVLVKQTGKDIVNAGRTVIDSVANFARPYGEVAKSQLDGASEKAKNLVHKGSKKLEKVFGDLANKTAKPKE